MKSSTNVLFEEIRLDCSPEIASTTDHFSTKPISDLVGSSCYRAVSDDASKDEDNAGWLMELDSVTRGEWINRISWIRLIDRLAEQELLYSGEPRFQKFLEEWKYLLATHSLPVECTFSNILTGIQAAWFGTSPRQLAIQAWDEYVNAIARYHSADLVIETLDDYEQMLVDLGGSLFRVLPYLSDQHQLAAQHFGVLDQFYNHLRDLHEDAEQGICYLPTELLDRFGVSREEILQQTASRNPGYHKMMTFWLEDYLPRLRQHAYQLLHIDIDTLHPSWQILRDWSVYRYRRIELTFRQCQFDYGRFSEVYWRQVQADLPMLLDRLRSQGNIRSQSCTGSPPANVSSNINILYGQLRGWKKRMVLSSVSTEFAMRPVA